ncbi:MAG: alpha/beta fold hydrolase [Desulfobacterales bacterium]|nr:alpha/beta fold hydrolase [Desulfobacterales bacterium]
MKNVITFFTCLVFMVFSAAPVGANAVIGDNLRLHIPWLVHEGVVYSLDLDAQLGGDPIYFNISGVRQRNVTLSPEAENAAATFLVRSRTLRIPRASFCGGVYSLDLLLTTRNGESVLNLAGAALAEEPADRGALVSATLLEQLNTSEILGLLPPGAGLLVQAQYPISIYKIVYATVDPYGNSTSASGILAAPYNLQSLPLFSYQHGTVVLKDSVPSSGESDGYFVAALMAGNGYLAVAPDYLGLGDSSGLHTYMHAKSSATAVVDLMRAAKEWAADEEVELNGQTFLAGYSEGGFVTMAAAREIEMFHAGEFTLTAVAPMAGPYSISGEMSQIILDGDSVTNPYYFPYTLLAGANVYGLGDEYGDLLASPYDTTILPLFDGQHSGSEINAALSTVPRDMLSDDLLEVYGVDEYAPINLALRDNDLYRWTPETKMNLYHCTADNQVPFANSQIAYDSFIANGAGHHVELMPILFGGHAACAIPAIFVMKVWFDSLVTP